MKHKEKSKKINCLARRWSLQGRFSLNCSQYLCLSEVAINGKQSDQPEFVLPRHCYVPHPWKSLIATLLNNFQVANLQNPRKNHVQARQLSSAHFLTKYNLHININITSSSLRWKPYWSIFVDYECRHCNHLHILFIHPVTTTSDGSHGFMLLLQHAKRG